MHKTLDDYVDRDIQKQEKYEGELTKEIEDLKQENLSLKLHLQKLEKVDKTSPESDLQEKTGSIFIWKTTI